MEPVQEIAEGLPADRLAAAQRSRITNHKDLLPGVKGTSAEARRFRDLVNAFVADMGGIKNCSEIKLGLLRRLAAATVQAELLEARMMNGEVVDVATLCTLASTTVRISVRLGLERVPRNVDETIAMSTWLRTLQAAPEPLLSQEGADE
jgi:hypothetical protein